MRRMVTDYVKKIFDTPEARERFWIHHDMTVDDWISWMEQEGVYGNIHAQFS